MFKKMLGDFFEGLLWLLIGWMFRSVEEAEYLAKEISNGEDGKLCQ